MQLRSNRRALTDISNNTEGDGPDVEKRAAKRQVFKYVLFAIIQCDLTLGSATIEEKL